MVKPKELQHVPCPRCGMHVPMPADWDGRELNEALCNKCYEEAERELEEKAVRERVKSQAH